MELDFYTAYEIGSNILSAFFESTFFQLIKMFLIVYTLVVLVDLFLLLYLSGIKSSLRSNIMGADIPTRKVKKEQKRWNAIRERLEGGNISQYKVAIIEADAIVDDIIEKIGYKGKNMSERLENVESYQLDYVDEIMAAHEVRNKIVHDEDFQISKEEAEGILDVYEKFLKYLEYLE